MIQDLVRLNCDFCILRMQDTAKNREQDKNEKLTTAHDTIFHSQPLARCHLLSEGFVYAADADGWINTAKYHFPSYNVLIKSKLILDKAGPTMFKKDEMWVIKTDKSPTAENADAVIESVREERHRQIIGPEVERKLRMH